MAARLLRGVLRRYGIVLDRTGTRSALRFICRAPSGRHLLLPGGIRVSTEFGAARVERMGQEDAPPPDRPLLIEGDSGRGAAVIGGRERRAEWRTEVWDGGRPAADRPVLPRDRVDGPLYLRGWLPGDRMKTPGGTKTLKKLFNQARVPRSARSRAAVLADAAGTVLWVAGIGQAVAPPRPGERALTLDLDDA